jgi:hypothetical protein
MYEDSGEEEAEAGEIVSAVFDELGIKAGADV